MEQYDVAAHRHFESAEHLEGGGHLCDAAYHFGLCGENAVKHALRVSGVEAFWQASGIRKHLTPMQGHFADLTAKVDGMRADIAANATGRLAAPILGTLLDPAFLGAFAGWSIMIRYADTGFTPVQHADCSRWKSEATDFLVSLVL